MAHCVLRGAVNQYGRSLPNYHYEDLQILVQLYAERDLKNPACLIDTNHANSSKMYEQQPRIAREVLHSRRLSVEIRQLVKGLMIESYLVAGNQPVTGQTYGQSITDACMGWPQTQELILKLADLA